MHGFQIFLHQEKSIFSFHFDVKLSACPQMWIRPGSDVSNEKDVKGGHSA